MNKLRHNLTPALPGSQHDNKELLARVDALTAVIDATPVALSTDKDNSDFLCCTQELGALAAKSQALIKGFGQMYDTLEKLRPLERFCSHPMLAGAAPLGPNSRKTRSS